MPFVIAKIRDLKRNLRRSDARGGVRCATCRTAPPLIALRLQLGEHEEPQRARQVSMEAFFRNGRDKEAKGSVAVGGDGLQSIKKLSLQ